MTTETCNCGSTIEYDRRFTTAFEIEQWRSEHRACREAEPMDIGFGVLPMLAWASVGGPAIRVDPQADNQ